MTRHNIKGRLATIGRKNVDVINELKNRGIFCSKSEFSIAIHGYNSPKAESICDNADKIITEWEGEKTNAKRKT